jgi:hypothetical protein
MTEVLRARSAKRQAEGMGALPQLSLGKHITSRVFEKIDAMACLSAGERIKAAAAAAIKNLPADATTVFFDEPPKQQKTGGLHYWFNYRLFLPKQPAIAIAAKQNSKKGHLVSHEMSDATPSLASLLGYRY